MHWPLAGVRAGVTEAAGAVMLLRGRRDFEFEPEPRRLLARWRWGDSSPGRLAEEQRVRQWTLMEAPPLAKGPSTTTIAELVQLVLREGRPEGFVLREGGEEPVAALLHWRRWQFLTVILGAKRADARKPLFVSTAAETRIEASAAGGVPGLTITRANAEPLFVTFNAGNEPR